MQELDLHGVKHKKAESLIDNFLASADLPCRIITGNSSVMKAIVQKIAKNYNLEISEENDWNLGAIIIYK